MRLSRSFALLAAVTGVLSYAVELPAGVPRSLQEFRDVHPYTPPSNGCGRKTVEIRASRNDTDDVSEEFRKGLQDANNGGTLYLPKGKTFVIAKALDLTFLNDVHVRLEGEIKFTNDVAYWQENAFEHPFQKSIMFWKWGGKDIKIYGDGVINGQGQRWWNEFNAGIGSNIQYKDVIATAITNNGSIIPKNTDFFDSLDVQDVRIERVWVNIDDDCFSPKSNNTNLYVNTMYCNGTHGQSIGSLGQYAGEMSFVKDVHIENVWMLNGDYSGARIKTWAGPNVGYGYVENITYKNFWLARMDYGIILDSCYFNINETTCEQYPSGMNVSNVLFENFTGYTSGIYGNAVAKLTCSTNPDAVCHNITVKNFNVTSPCGGEPVIICDGIDGGIDTPCVSIDSDEAKAALAAKCQTPLAPIDTKPW
ncbi:putative exopolygalacturonase B [Colletotrichum sp. SAR 10_70]|nr:putative exopolygalacturonase B [Colletotrichum sp. SAR 10_71]KAI8183924.1 putative exopolygalacturonase B [Colletotrichum sp. SAR 10_75]KAI8201436.1 putative exopolygalacturonase B [Colletotrichum sp. SAR 10_70]KAI8214649.1 putative exopolygalacturonase B [Colletotrichum sp. SAR 10_76]KAI8247603.1 putative exopolygalacturonase B [Colletotrichum sp. SAR 10_77]KAJ5006391.1 putative exopolygalacturonase B [Colletotrichum sp. SAR 10_66]